jgi:SAM-dependent methyltransferase
MNISVKNNEIDMSCRVCGNDSNNKKFIATEKMYGLGDEFDYIECNNCGCLQIANIPENISRYYPSENYYSYKDTNGLKLFLKNLYINHKLTHPKIFKELVSTLFYNENYNFINLFKSIGITNTSEILDVGCGSGDLLQSLHFCGFENLRGIDPFISSDINHRNGIVIEKKALNDVVGTYDFVMLHHSFEHMPDPIESLREIHRIIKSNSHVLIRIPLSSSYAYQEYGVNWVQLDAPRHFHLHTLASMKILADKTGFKIIHTLFDSSDFQFVGSEKYKKGIPLLPQDKSNSKLNFTRAQISDFRRKAREMNEQSNGDQACFVLLKENV